MVHFDTVLIRYGELSTKGKNRKDFINRLYQNIRSVFSMYPDLEFRKTHDRIYITLHRLDSEIVKERLSRVFGISSFSFTIKVASDLDVITQTCLDIAKDHNGKTFKMIAKRHDKTFPKKSDEINREIAAVILKNTDCKVDVHQPELPIQIEIQKDDTYITYEKIKGAGGYPTGVNGKVLLLLSGGIDSPVAAYEIMKRGIEVEAVHYASPPYTSENAKQKVLDLASMVSVYQGRMKVHMINFTDLQLEIYRQVGDAYAITIMRRMMFRIAERIAQNTNCLAIATGESVGQVASQTLESIACINDVVRIPVLRPLVSFDKLEIIDVAQKIGTYETSILPFEDCCTIFDPKNPVTKPTTKKSEMFESKFNFEEYLVQCMENDEIINVYPQQEQEEFL